MRKKGKRKEMGRRGTKAQVLRRANGAKGWLNWTVVGMICRGHFAPKKEEELGIGREGKTT